MPIVAEFEYVKPKDLEEALRVLSLHMETAKVLAGGTDLIVHLKKNLIRPEVVVDLKGVSGLDKINFKKGVLSVGSLVTFAQLIDSPLVGKYCPLLREAVGTVASTGVRNRATMAGNLCSAVPSADSAPVLAVYDAAILVKSLRGERRISIHNWFAGPKKTALACDELVLAVELALPEPKTGGCYAKLSRYEGEDLAQGGIAVLALAGGAFRVAACALGPKPARCPQTEAVLNGDKLSAGLIAKAKETLLREISPITDLRSTKEYRSHMAAVMLGRALEAAVSRLSGGGPKYGESVI
ncbi:MAG: xanthine dehydrogenase family protein subunit M [Elusimicrobiales bacterium]|jgi:carbon-monoxide dehydrogenase medium subunit